MIHGRKSHLIRHFRVSHTERSTAKLLTHIRIEHTSKLESLETSGISNLDTLQISFPPNRQHPHITNRQIRISNAANPRKRLPANRDVIPLLTKSIFYLFMATARDPHSPLSVSSKASGVRLDHLKHVKKASWICERVALPRSPGALWKTLDRDPLLNQRAVNPRTVYNPCFIIINVFGIVSENGSIDFQIRTRDMSD